MSPRSSVYKALSAEWGAVGQSRQAKDALARWSVRQPSLESYTSPAEIVAICRANMGAEANRLLAALIALDDPLASRAVLQALLPGLAAMSRRARRAWPWMFDSRCDSPWVAWGFDHDAVSIAHSQIRARASDP